MNGQHWEANCHSDQISCFLILYTAAINMAWSLLGSPQNSQAE